MKKDINTSIKQKIKNLVLVMTNVFMIIIIVLLLHLIFMDCYINRGVGNSMLPTLDSRDTMIVKVYRENTSLQVGDIILYTHYRDASDKSNYINVCHRIVDIHDDGTITTKGDNNKQEDYWSVLPKNIMGVVKYKVRFDNKLKIQKISRAMPLTQPSNENLVDIIEIFE